MNNKKLNIVLIAALIILAGVIVYQNFLSGSSTQDQIINAEEVQLWTCGMHPDIISEEPGNCPICGMKLTPVKDNNSKSNTGEKEILYWVAPMDPNEIYDSPGKSKMGMDLVPVYADEAGQAGVVTIDPSIQQNMNVKFTTIENRALDPTIKTNATFTVDERKEYQITSRVVGWIEKMSVNYTGQQVNKGEELLQIYSPELVSAQQEYLTALKYKEKVSNSSLASSGDELIDNTYRKLTLLNMSPKEIFALESSGEVKTTVPLYSPISGTVLMKNVVEGQKIKSGENLLHIANLSTLWLKADVYESDISHVKVGDNVIVNVDAYPGRPFNGKVSFIYPTIDPKSRTIQVRIDVQNPNKKLKPAMLAIVTINTGETKSLPVIPESAVIRSGEQNVAVQFLGEGKFKPVTIELGDYSNGYYQVLAGLSDGNKVVTSAQFLIDSESSLKSAMKNFSKAEPSEMTNMINEQTNDSPLIRKGTIDLKSIDKNTDGMVYQDQMDWNVISDEPGKCPICEMNLKEVTLGKAKENLINNGYGIKGMTSNSTDNSTMEMDSKTTKQIDEQSDEMNHDHSSMNEYGIDSPLIRTGEIDIEAIDTNGDGKLYECPMDWNVLADEYQRCPVCEMKMKEYTLDEVKDNLEKHGYEYKK